MSKRGRKRKLRIFYRQTFFAREPRISSCLKISDPEPAQSIRETKDISVKNWSGGRWQMCSLDLLPQVVGRGTEDTTFLEVVESSSFGAAGEPLLVHLKGSTTAACLGEIRTATTSCSVPVEEPERVEERQIPGLISEN